MTSRERRLLRLTVLRERQHDVAAARLRAARSQLAEAESAVIDAQERTRAAQLCRLSAAMEDEANEWLLACADMELGLLAIRKHQAQQKHAEAMADEAAQAETDARRERKQMEATLAPVQAEGLQRARRIEQGTLDEIARVQRAAWARRSAGGGNL